MRTFIFCVLLGFSRALPQNELDDSMVDFVTALVNNKTQASEVSPKPATSAPALSSQQTTKPVANKDDQADFGEFPWMIAVLDKRGSSSVWNLDDYRGGGALIHPSVVLTVAHTVNDVTQTLKCRAGEWDTQTTLEQYPFQERDVIEKLVHPKYSRPSLKFDFALLVLASPFELAQAPHIGVACLARALPAPGTVCYGMGWSKNAKNKFSAVVLKKIRRTMMDPVVCANSLKDSYGPFFRVHKSLTCAVGVSGPDFCCEDGGAPLVCPVDSSASGERRYVVGLVAYGLQCGLEDAPAMYANVPQARAWVDTVVAQHHLPPLENCEN